MRSFEFKKSYEEIKINGEIYKVDFSDNKVLEYQKLFRSFYATSLELNEEGKDINKTQDQEKEYFDKSLKLVKDTLEGLLGENTFDKIYEQSGKSLINIVDLVTFLADTIQEKMTSLKDEKLEKYVGKKKKVK